VRVLADHRIDADDLASLRVTSSPAEVARMVTAVRERVHGGRRA